MVILNSYLVLRISYLLSRCLAELGITIRFLQFYHLSELRYLDRERQIISDLRGQRLAR